MSNQIETQIDVTLTDRNRLTALFRVVLVLPIAIFAGSFIGTLDFESQLGTTAGGAASFAAAISATFSSGVSKLCAHFESSPALFEHSH